MKASTSSTVTCWGGLATTVKKTFRSKNCAVSVFARTLAALNRRYSSTSGSPRLGTAPDRLIRHGLNDPTPLIPASSTGAAGASIRPAPPVSRRDALITYISSRSLEDLIGPPQLGVLALERPHLLGLHRPNRGRPQPVA